MPAVVKTASTANPCGCCPDCSNALLSCRNRGGILDLCGRGAFADPEIPPRAYKRYAISGSMQTRRFFDNTCAVTCAFFAGAGGAFGPGVFDLSGDGTYVGSYSYTVTKVTGGYTVKFNGGTWTKSDGNTGGFTSLTFSAATVATGATSGVLACGEYDLVRLNFSLFGGRSGFAAVFGGPSILPNISVGDILSVTTDTWDYVQTYTPFPELGDVNLCVADPPVDNNQRDRDGTPEAFPSGTPLEAYGGGADVSESATERTTVGGESCGGPDADGFYNKLLGSVRETLSDEDTEDAAIDRFKSVAAYGDWKVPGETGCTDSSCCLAQWQIREEGFSFVYADAQFRVEKTGLAPNATYQIKVPFYRRVFGVGEFALWETHTLSGTTDANGILTLDEQDVPNERGYETRPGPACVIIPYYELTTAVIGSGSISPSAGNFPSGESVALTATPSSGWHLVGWTGDLSSTVNPAHVVMDSEKHVIAQFELDAP